MKIKKNPLSIALGIFFSEERKKLNDPSVSAVVRKFELGNFFENESSYSESLYRMVESGNARIHPKHLFEFIRVFEVSNIKIEPFCQLVIAIQFLDAYLDDKLQFNKAYNYLKQSGDSKYEALLDSIYPFIKDLDKSYPVIKEKMISGMAIQSVRQFLSRNTHEDFGKSAHEIHELRVFHNVPTIYHGFIDTFVNNLLSLPIEINGNSLWKWEESNLTSIEYVYSIAKDVESIISLDNFRRYKYKFVLAPNSNFKEAHLIFLTKENSKVLKKKFSSLLKQALLENKEDQIYLENFDSKMEKIFIYNYLSIPKDLQKRIFSKSTSLDLTDVKDYYNIAWAFQLRDTKVGLVGFKGCIDKKTWLLSEALNLNWSDTKSLITEIKELIGL